jgi:hypothetical protein
MLVKPLRARAIALYRDAFGTYPGAAASAPGCVDLWGGHTLNNLPLTARKLAGVAFRAGPDHQKTRQGIAEHTMAALAQAGRALRARGIEELRDAFPSHLRVRVSQVNQRARIERIKYQVAEEVRTSGLLSSQGAHRPTE